MWQGITDHFGMANLMLTWHGIEDHLVSTTRYRRPFLVCELDADVANHFGFVYFYCFMNLVVSRTAGFLKLLYRELYGVMKLVVLRTLLFRELFFPLQVFAHKQILTCLFWLCTLTRSTWISLWARAPRDYLESAGSELFRFPPSRMITSWDGRPLANNLLLTPKIW